MIPSQVQDGKEVLAVVVAGFDIDDPRLKGLLSAVDSAVSKWAWEHGFTWRATPEERLSECDTINLLA